MLSMFNICSEVEWKSDGIQAANAELFQLKAIKVPVTYLCMLCSQERAGKRLEMGAADRWVLAGS